MPDVKSGPIFLAAVALVGVLSLGIGFAAQVRSQTEQNQREKELLEAVKASIAARYKEVSEAILNVVAAGKMHSEIGVFESHRKIKQGLKEGDQNIKDIEKLLINPSTPQEERMILLQLMTRFVAPAHPGEAMRVCSDEFKRPRSGPFNAQTGWVLGEALACSSKDPVQRQALIDETKKGHQNDPDPRMMELLNRFTSSPAPSRLK